MAAPSTEFRDLEEGALLIERPEGEDASSVALTSVKKWEDLNLTPELLKGIYDKGFSKPSRIQEMALPLVLESNCNLIAQAHNGSGKTATFSLCMLAKVRLEVSSPQSLCICHTRELAKQNMDVIQRLGQYTNITTWLAVPGAAEYNASTGAQVVVGTPGKLRDVLKRRIFSTKEVSLFVLDEADVMMAGETSMSSQVAEIRRSLPSKLQCLLFSATYPDRVKSFCQVHVPNAHSLSVKREELTLSEVRQFYVRCSAEEKIKILAELYAYMVIGQSVIFVNTRRDGFEVAEKMKNEGHSVTVICGSGGASEGLDHETREKVMLEFREGVTKVLIATDLISRGIDVPQVTMVVNYSLPQNFRGSIDCETYLHRIGRTGRFGAKGIAINLCDNIELENLDRIRAYYKCEITELPADGEEVEKIVKNLRR